MMRNKIIYLWLFSAVFLFQNILSAQTDEINWKVLTTSNNKKIWYDATTIDSIKGREFSIWTLELHKPPLTIPGVNEQIYKSKTLYRISLNLLRYGIAEIVYFNSSDKQIANYKYEIPGEKDDYEYSYPSLENNIITGILKKFIKNKELNNK